MRGRVFGPIQAFYLRETTMVMVPAGEHSLFSRPRIKFWTYLFLWLTVVATAGCDSSSSYPASNGTQPRVEKLKTNINADEARQLAEPISKTPGLSVDANAAQNMAIGNEVYNGMEPPKGLKTSRLFDTSAGNDDARFARLEAAVQKLRDDFDSVSPSINRLISIEGEIQSLVDQLNVLVDQDSGQQAIADVPPVSAAMIEENNTNDAGMANEAPVPIAPPPPPAAAAKVETPVKEEMQKPVAAVSGTDRVTAIRIGDHDTTVRIVLETTADLPYTATIDPEKILIVSFIKAGAAETVSAANTKSGLIKSIDATPQGNGGLIVAMPLAKDSKIVRQGVLKPDGENSRYRIYIDLQK